MYRVGVWEKWQEGRIRRAPPWLNLTASSGSTVRWCCCCREPSCIGCETYQIHAHACVGRWALTRACWRCGSLRAPAADIVRQDFAFVDEDKNGVITKDELLRTSKVRVAKRSGFGACRHTGSMGLLHPALHFTSPTEQCQGNAC